MVREVLRERFIDTLKEFGGSAVNGRMREALGWREDARRALLDEARFWDGDGDAEASRFFTGESLLYDLALLPAVDRSSPHGVRA